MSLTLALLLRLQDKSVVCASPGVPQFCSLLCHSKQQHKYPLTRPCLHIEQLLDVTDRQLLIWMQELNAIETNVFASRKFRCDVVDNAVDNYLMGLMLHPTCN
jgi:hypothetical protein